VLWLRGVGVSHFLSLVLLVTAVMLADGIFVVGGSMAIILLAFSGYRRATALVAGGLLIMMTTTMVRFAAGMSEVQADAMRSAKSNPVGAAVTKLLSQSVGLEWGWFLLFGGAFTVVICALLLSSSRASESYAARPEGPLELSPADRLIAEYLEKAQQAPKNVAPRPRASANEELAKRPARTTEENRP